MENSWRFPLDDLFTILKKASLDKNVLAPLRETFGNEALSEKTVYNCFAEFRHGRVSDSDKSREGWPKSVVIPNNIDAVHKMIEEDLHVMCRKIEATLCISQTALHSISQNI